MITHDLEQKKFIIENPEGTSYIEYTDDNGCYTVIHTIVPKELSGRGIAAQLCDAFYNWVSENHYPMKSECSYMTAWLKRNKKEIQFV